MDRFEDSQRVILLSGKVEVRKHLVLDRLQPIIGPPEVQIGLLLEGVESRFASGCLQICLVFRPPAEVGELSKRHFLNIIFFNCYLNRQKSIVKTIVVQTSIGQRCPTTASFVPPKTRFLLKTRSAKKMIIEGVLTTVNADFEVNFAPMGPIVNESMTEFVLRPFQTSNTYRNLKSRPHGVFHITDDVLLIAGAALNRLSQLPATFSAERVMGRVLSDCCRWYEFEVVELDDSSERTSIVAKVVHSGHRREMSGFNRAKNAVLEATILATRLHLIAQADVRGQLASLASPVEKTAGPKELEAFQLVVSYVTDWYEQRNAIGR